MRENDVAKVIVDAGYRVHTTLGPGLLESFYETALAFELEKRGLSVVRQQAVAAVYQRVEIRTAFHADLIVEDNVIVEIKAVEPSRPCTRGSF
jgi:GxxExxY protein